MLAGAIVPEGDGIRPPAEAALIFGDRGLRIEIFQQRIGFGLVHPHDMLCERDIDVEALAPGFGMGADHGVFGRGIFFVEFLDLGFAFALFAQADAEMGKVMNSRAPVDLRPDLVRQPVIGGIHIGKQCIAANRRHLKRTQDRTERGLQPPGDVAVPGVFPAAAVLIMGDGQHFGVTGLVGCKGVHLQRTERTRKGKMLFGGNVLIAEEKDFPVQKGSPETFERFIVRLPRKIDSGDHRADGRGQWFKLER